MSNPQVRDWMTSTPIVAERTLLLDDAFRLLQNGDIRHLPIVDGEKLLGLVTKDDVRRAQLATADKTQDVSPTVEGIMTLPPTVTASDSMAYAALLLLRHKLSALPVVDTDARLVGILTQSDLMHRILLEANPPPAPKRIIVKGGIEVVIRPIHPHDAPQLRALYDNLSEDSRYLRFLTTRNPIKPQHIRRMVISDYADQMAYVAIEPATNQLIGIAQYLPFIPPEQGKAEFAIAIADLWQGKGIGTQLLSELFAYAQGQNMIALLGVVSTANTPMLGLINKLGYKTKQTSNGETNDIWVILK